MKVIYETVDLKLVMVEFAPGEAVAVYHGDKPDLLLHKDVTERTRLAFDAAGVDGADVIGMDLDFSETEREAVLASAIHYKVVPVRRARAPKSEILRRQTPFCF